MRTTLPFLGFNNWFLESSKVSGISSEEAAAFQSESLVMKQRFDEVHLIETQVADIAHITQQINENIESQAEIADEIHQNVKTYI